MHSEHSILLTEEAPAYPGWRVAIASGIGVFVSFASLFVYTFGVFLKPFAEQFNWSRQAVSSAFGFAAMTVALCSPALGHLLDRYGPRRIILPCLTVFGCAFASLSLLTANIWHLYATFIVLGIVGNGTAQLAYSRSISTWFEHRRGTAFGIVMTGGAVGAMVLPPIAQALIRSFGWRTACALLGSMVLIIGLPVVGAFVREKPGARRPHETASSGASLGQGLRSRAFWILVVVLFLGSISQNGALTHLSALLTDRGIPASSAAIALSVLGGASLLGRLVTGWLLDRFFAPRVAVCLLTLAALGVFLLSTANSLFIGSLAAALIGLGMGGEADVTPYLLTRYFGLRAFSTLYGLTWTAYAIAGAIGPILMGRAFDASSSYQSFVAQLSILTLASAALMLFMPSYHTPQPETRSQPDPQNISPVFNQLPPE